MQIKMLSRTLKQQKLLNNKLQKTGLPIYKWPSFNIKDLKRLTVKNYLYTIAILTAKEEHFEDLKKLLEELAEETRKEAGSHEYFFVLDQNKPNTFVSYERWESAEDEDAHWQIPHFRKAFAYFDEYLAEPLTVHRGYKAI